MVDAESKIKTDVKHKRIRHAYPRKEVYHRWIHSPEYVYVNRNHQISGKEDYLRIGDIGKDRSRILIERDVDCGWSFFSVIDRDTNRILISDKYPVLAWELLQSIPDEYEVFRCHGSIPCHDILSEEHTELLCKIHLEYVIRDYTSKYLYPYYAILKGKNVLHSDINIDTSKDAINSRIRIHKKYNILTFIKKYKIKQYDWYNKALDPNYKLYVYYPNSYSIINIALPTVKQLITGNIFNKKQIELFKKKRFYTKYCYGRGIPFSDVDKYFGTSITHDEAVSYCNRKHIHLNTDWLVDVNTWNDLISKTKEIEDKAYKNYIDEQIAKSEENYKYALEELRKLESEYTVNAWREGRFKNSQLSVSYQKFNAPSRRNKTYSWTTTTIRSNNKTFTNTQLKLEGNTIHTSRNASVTLEEGIKMYKMFKIGRTNNPSCTSWTERNFGKVNVGIYNLRFITYKEKTTDTGVKLGRKEWCIQIGCHSLWLDDIEDFIKYYHLEDKFGIKNDNKNKPIKLKIK